MPIKQNYFQRRSKPQGPKANERIRALDVQVIGSDGNNLGTLALNKATLPFLSKLAKDGYIKALSEDPNFLAGLNVHKGNVTYKAVANVFGHSYVSPEEIIN